MEKTILDGLMDAAERKVRLDLQMARSRADVTGFCLWSNFSDEDVQKAVQAERDRAVRKFYDKLYAWCITE